MMYSDILITSISDFFDPLMSESAFENNFGFYPACTLFDCLYLVIHIVLKKSCNLIWKIVECSKLQNVGGFHLNRWNVKLCIMFNVLCSWYLSHRPQSLCIWKFCSHSHCSFSPVSWAVLYGLGWAPNQQHTPLCTSYKSTIFDII